MTNPKEKEEITTRDDLNKNKGRNQKDQPKSDEKGNAEKRKSKLNSKFGGGSSYGSSRIGQYWDDKTSIQVPQDEKRTYSVPNSGSAVDESGSQTSKPLEKDSYKDKKPKH